MNGNQFVNCNSMELTTHTQNMNYGPIPQYSMLISSPFGGITMQGKATFYSDDLSING